jgi:hypothetical protein
MDLTARDEQEQVYHCEQAEEHAQEREKMHPPAIDE